MRYANTWTPWRYVRVRKQRRSSSSSSSVAPERLGLGRLSLSYWRLVVSWLVALFYYDYNSMPACTLSYRATQKKLPTRKAKHVIGREKKKKKEKRKKRNEICHSSVQTSESQCFTVVENIVSSCSMCFSHNSLYLQPFTRERKLIIRISNDSFVFVCYARNEESNFSRVALERPSKCFRVCKTVFIVTRLRIVVRSDRLAA